MVLALSGIVPMLVLFIILLTDVIGQAQGTILIDLNGEWIAKTPGSSSIYAAKVPGNIYTDLMRNGTLNQDPYYRNNDEAYRWVSKLDWEFSRSFFVPSNVNSTKILLKADGLDTIASIFINGRLQGSTDNQFVQYYFDIKDSLLINAQNNITIKFSSPTSYATQKFYQHIFDHRYLVPPICPPPEFHGDCHPNFIRKAQHSFAWDWGPSFPTVGIWRNISIVAYNTALIEAVTVSPMWSQSVDKWAIKVQVHLIGSNKPQKASIVTEIPELGLSQTENIQVPPGTSNVTFLYRIKKKVEKWWPNGYGGQKLYALQVTLQDRNHLISAQKAMEIGFRTVELVQEPLANNATGLTFYFRVNGVAIWVKGSNWIPAHAFQDAVTETYVRWLLESTMAANMNMLRVWGGGYYESEFFYRTCDQLGILIWQDFMFACAMYPTTSDFLTSVRGEVRSNILRIQYHPSIALWSANNENEVAYVENWYLTKAAPKTFKDDYIKLYIDVIRDECLKYEIDDRPWIPSSPTNGKLTEEEGWIAKDPRSNLYGDAHFYSYLVDPWDWRLYPPTRFASEYGFQSWDSVETLLNYSEPTDRTYYSDFADSRQHHPLGQTEMLFEIYRRFKLPSLVHSQRDFPAFIYLTQVNQAMGLQTETEYYRRIQSTIFPDSSGGTKGALYWQLNSIWPSPSWSSIEFGGKWKISHYYIKDFFEPVMLSPYVENDTFFISFINDNLSTVAGQLQLDVYDLTVGFEKKSSISSTVKQAAQSASVVYEEGVNTLLSRSGCSSVHNCFVVASLFAADLATTIGVPNIYWLGFPKDANIPKATLKIVDVQPVDGSFRRFTISIESSWIAPFTYIEAIGLCGRFSKNGWMLHNPTEDIEFFSNSDITVDMLKANVKIMSLMDIYK